MLYGRFVLPIRSVHQAALELQEHLFLLEQLLALFINLEASFLVALHRGRLGLLLLLLLLLLHFDLVDLGLQRSDLFEVLFA